MADITITFTLFGVFSITLVTANPELVALSIVAVVVIVIAYVVCQKATTDNNTSEKTE